MIMMDVSSQTAAPTISLKIHVLAPLILDWTRRIVSPRSSWTSFTYTYLILSFLLVLIWYESLDVMSYIPIPDFCKFEFTPGQMVKMSVDTKAEKDLIYCNYANVEDPAKCSSISCGHDSTSSNCPSQEPTFSVWLMMQVFLLCAYLVHLPSQCFIFYL